jgi:hypothetical protein
MQGPRFISSFSGSGAILPDLIIPEAVSPQERVIAVSAEISLAVTSCVRHLSQEDSDVMGRLRTIIGVTASSRNRPSQGMHR